MAPSVEEHSYYLHVLLVDVMSQVGKLSVAMRTGLGLAGAAAGTAHWLPTIVLISQLSLCVLIGQTVSEF